MSRPPLQIRKWKLGDKLPPIVSREEAIRAGKKTFFTGKPCRSGHYSIRYTSTQACLECLHPTIRGPHALDSKLPLDGLRFDPRLTQQQWLELIEQTQAYVDLLQAAYIPQDVALEIRPIHGVDHYPGGKTPAGYLYWLPVDPEKRKHAFGGEAKRLCTPEGLRLPWVQYPDGSYGAYDLETNTPYYILCVDRDNLDE